MLRQVQREPGGETGLRIGARRLRLGPARAAETIVAVEERHVSRPGTSHVDLDEHRAGEDVGDSKDKVGQLREAHVAGPSDLDHGMRAAGVGEAAASGAELGPGFAYEPASGRDDQSVAEEVDTVGEVDEFVRLGGSVDNGLKTCRVVRDAVARHRVLRHVLDVDHLGYVVLGVSGLRYCVVEARAVDETVRSRGGNLLSSNELRRI